MRYLIIMVLLATPAFAEMAKSNAPIEITADKLDVLQNEQQAIFTGRVRAKQDKAILSADTMKVYYRKSEEKAAEQQAVSKIEATGNVALSQEGENAHGDSGVYMVDEDMIILQGNVILNRGENTLKGNKLIYNTKTGKSSLLSATNPDGKSGRVKAVFTPKAK